MYPVTSPSNSEDVYCKLNTIKEYPKKKNWRKFVLFFQEHEVTCALPTKKKMISDEFARKKIRTRGEIVMSFFFKPHHELNVSSGR